MIGEFVTKARAKLEWQRHLLQLNAMTEMRQFDAYVEQVRPPAFLQYKAASLDKRAEFLAVIGELALQLCDLAFLDLGPGYGDALDICHEQGARTVVFSDIEPFFYTYNRLKPFAEGYRIDNQTRQLRQLGQGRFDIIWAKGAFGADNFVYPDRAKFWLLPLPEWLAHIDCLAAPGGQIIMTPHWRHDGQSYEVGDLRENYFSQTLLAHGYEILPPSTRNANPAYPLTFFKRVRKEMGSTPNA
jgi:hypothetical protein